jgi:hypothetical protein
MGLPRLLGKALNTRIIYRYRPDSMAVLVLWIPSRRRKGVRDYRLSRERQFQEFSDSLRTPSRSNAILLYEVNVLRKSGQVWEKQHESSLYLHYVVPAYAVLYNRLFPHTRINKRKDA